MLIPLLLPNQNFGSKRISVGIYRTLIVPPLRKSSLSVLWLVQSVETRRVVVEVVEVSRMASNHHSPWTQGCTIRSGGACLWFPWEDGVDSDCAMYRIAYTPYGAIGCTATQANVTKDIKQLSQLTTRLRLYAADWSVHIDRWANMH
jgi:hypothetical protein